VKGTEAPAHKNLPRPGEVPIKAGVRPVPPGVFLQENFLSPQGLGVEKAAEKMRMPVAVLADILAQRRPIDAETALRIAEFTDTKPRVWLNMQAAADYAKVNLI
jgi:addiction module HigA family antidote